MQNKQFDIVVVGAGIAGCTAAILYARDRHRVALVERHSDVTKHKVLCTHYIQACATPTMRRLGIDKVIEAAGAIRNSADLWTKYGWAVEPDMRDENGVPLHGYSVRRQTLDPLLRQMAINTPNVTYFGGCSVDAVTRVGGRISGVRIRGGESFELKAKLAVAADGRNSPTATLAGISYKDKPNRRAAVFAQFRNVKFRSDGRAGFWITDAGSAYVFPNEDGVTVLAAMPDRDCLPPFEENVERAFIEFFDRLADAPDLSAVERITEYAFVRDYPNRARPPEAQGMALVGDAAASEDPLFGVGCGWAFQSAAWLVDETSHRLWNPDEITAGLKAYRARHKRMLGWHRFVMEDYSRRKKFNAIERLMYSAAAKDEACAAHLHRFAKRIDSLGDFLAPRAILAAIRAQFRAGERRLAAGT